MEFYRVIATMASVPSAEGRTPSVISSLVSLIVEVEDNNPQDALVKPLLDLVSLRKTLKGHFNEETFSLRIVALEEFG